MRYPSYIFATALLASLLLASQAYATPVQNLDRVGSATLKVWFWTIYDSRLYSPDGRFDGIEPGLALELDYRRDIRTDELIKRTRQEWQKLDLNHEKQEAWLDQLAALWPNIQEGDELVLHVGDKLSSKFYYNGEPIGEISDAEFTNQFLAIWLSEKSSYPKLRDQLVGLAN